MGRARIRAGLDECPVLKLLLALTHEPLQVNQSPVSYTIVAVAFVSENGSRTFAKMATKGWPATSSQYDTRPFRPITGS